MKELKEKVLGGLLMTEAHKYTIIVEGETWDDVHNLIVGIQDESQYMTHEDERINADILKVTYEEKVD